MITFEESRAGYLAMWTRAKLLDAKRAAALNIARKISDSVHRSAFQAVEAATGVPWYVVGCLLERESDGNLNTYLGNGQRLSEVTSLVPAGRGPFKGPTAFLDGAVDALKHEGMTGITDWSIERILYWCERFNGQGYFGRGNSPYIWSWTDQYTSGKFVDEQPGVKAHYDPTHVDEQPGVAAILKALAEIYPDIAAKLASRPAAIPSSPQETKPMPTTTTAVAPIQMGDPIPSIIAFLEIAKKYLPMFSGFLPPPLGPVVNAAVPIVEELLQLIEDAKSKTGVDLFQTIGAHIETIGKHVQTTASTASQVTTQGAPTNGMPNS
jgi:lysozyme family protein